MPKTIQEGLAKGILFFIVGVTILGIVGLINGNFFPKIQLNQIQITKSPLQIVYKGQSKENIIDIVKEIKDIPFKPYQFNSSTKFIINNEETITKSNTNKVDLSSEINSNIKVPQGPQIHNPE